MSLLFPHRRVDIPEYMDDWKAPTGELIEDLRNLQKFNQWLRAHSIILSYLVPFVAEQHPPQPIRILDVGTGGADLPIAIADSFRIRGWRTSILGIDVHPTTIRFAAETTAAHHEIALVQSDVLALPFKRGSFHYVLASQLLHHFDQDDVLSILQELFSLATHGVIIGDLIRSPLAYAGAFLLARLMTRNRLTRHDAPVSVRRAFSLEELRSLRTAAGLSYAIHRHFPFRFCLVEKLADRGEA